MSDLENELRAEREIISRATAGPWRADHSRDYESDVYAVFHNGDTPDQDLITTIPKPFMRDVGPDAEFIAHARTALPLRSAQVAKVLHECGEMEWWAQNCFDVGKDAEGKQWIRAAKAIRRAIEEAGA